MSMPAWWGDLLVAVALVFAVNVLPAFGPPTWTVLVYFRVAVGVPIPPLVVCGAAAAAMGRLVLALLFRRLGSHLPERRRVSLDALGATLSGSRGGLLAALVFFAVSPVPSSSVFEAVGLARVRLGPLVAAFLAGRLVSYSVYLVAASTVSHQIGSILEEGVASPRALIAGLLGLAGVGAMVLVDWVRVIAWLRAHTRRGPSPPSRSSSSRTDAS